MNTTASAALAVAAIAVLLAGCSSGIQADTPKHVRFKPSEDTETSRFVLDHGGDDITITPGGSRVLVTGVRLEDGRARLPGMDGSVADAIFDWSGRPQASLSHERWDGSPADYLHFYSENRLYGMRDGRLRTVSVDPPADGPHPVVMAQGIDSDEAYDIGRVGGREVIVLAERAPDLRPATTARGLASWRLVMRALDTGAVLAHSDLPLRPEGLRVHIGADAIWFEAGLNPDFGPAVLQEHRIYRSEDGPDGALRIAGVLGLDLAPLETPPPALARYMAQREGCDEAREDCPLIADLNQAGDILLADTSGYTVLRRDGMSRKVLGTQDGPVFDSAMSDNGVVAFLTGLPQPEKKRFSLMRRGNEDGRRVILVRY